MNVQRVGLALLIVGFLIGLVGVTGPFSVIQLVTGLIIAAVGTAIVIGATKKIIVMTSLSKSTAASTSIPRG